MEITCYNDVHLYGPHAMTVAWDFHNPSHYYLGDNVDISNCPPKLLEAATKHAEKMVELFPGRCVVGNHELETMGPHIPVFLRVGKTLLTHGHHLFWSDSYRAKYEDREPGMPVYKMPLDLGMWIGRLDGLRHVFRPGITKLFCLRIEQLAQTYNVDMIVCGHRHPPKKICETIAGVEVVVLPRGRNTLTIR